MNVLVLNTHSLLNSGDAGIVFSQIRLLREFLPGAALSLTSRTPRLDEAVFEPLGVRVFPPLIPARGILRGGRGRSEFLAALRSSDLILASGGGYFWSNRRAFPGRIFWQNALPILWARRLRRPLLFMPQSFGPMFSRPAAGLLAGCLGGRSVVRIFAREKASMDYLEAVLRAGPNRDKTALCPDLAFALSEGDQEAPAFDLNLPAPILAMTLRTWDFPEAAGPRDSARRAEEYFSAVVETARRFIRRRGGSVLVFPQVRGPWAFENDRAISRRFCEALSRTEDPSRVRFLDLPDTVHPGRIISLFRQVDAVISTRLHSAVFALLAGRIPAVIGYQPKSAGTMAMLGLASFCLDIGRLDPDRLFDLVEKSMDGPIDATDVKGRTVAAGLEIRAKIGAALSGFAHGGAS